MSIEAAKLEALLYESESTTLDFKRDQYVFVGATDEMKSELLKDILAFANAWRRSEAYILIGIDDGKGAKSLVTGVSSHLSDSDLQQFVNSKTQRPIQFSYSAIEFEGKQIAIISIPEQTRPIYLKKDFGKLKKGEVYVRRGSSTDIMSPDEIARLGHTVVTLPVMTLQFRDKATGHLTVGTFNAKATKIQISGHAEYPDYGQRHSMGGGMFVFNDAGMNKNYYRELVEYCEGISPFVPIYFAVHNSGSVVANDVVVEISIPGATQELQIVNDGNLPTPPAKNNLFRAVMRNHLNRTEDVTVTRLSTSWLVRVRFGKVQPKSTVWHHDTLFFKTTNTRSLDLQALIFADNIPEPVKVPLTISVEVEEQRLSLEELIASTEEDLPEGVERPSSPTLDRIRRDFL
jgi:Putative DNA-binding domain